MEDEKRTIVPEKTFPYSEEKIREGRAKREAARAATIKRIEERDARRKADREAKVSWLKSQSLSENDQALLNWALIQKSDSRINTLYAKYKTKEKNQ